MLEREVIGFAISDSGPGAVSLAPVPELGLQGLPVQLMIENDLPCGDEGEGPRGGFRGYLRKDGL